MKRIGWGLMILLNIGLNATDDSMILDGYLRGTYHTHDIKNDKFYRDDAIGGKLHFETASYENFTLGSSGYAVTKAFNDDNSPLIRLRGEDSKSYVILGELYLNGEFGNTTFKIGRQELNTPFAEMDDGGMIPNTFEALSLINKDIENLEVFLGQINKMSGVDAEVVEKFTRINGSDNMQILSLSYEGIKDIKLEAWYNRLKNAKIDKMLYLESSYENKLNDYSYNIALQYSKQSYLKEQDASVWGIQLDIGLAQTGFLLSSSYNEVSNNIISSGFGAGPFFTSSEFVVLDNVGVDGNAKRMGIEYDASNVGINGLFLFLSKMYLETKTKQKSSELDMTLSYDVLDDVNIHVTYAEIEGVNVGLDDATHFHIYVNYYF